MIFEPKGFRIGDKGLWISILFRYTKTVRILFLSFNSIFYECEQFPKLLKILQKHAFQCLCNITPRRKGFCLFHYFSHFWNYILFSFFLLLQITLWKTYLNIRLFEFLSIFLGRVLEKELQGQMSFKGLDDFSEKLYQFTLLPQHECLFNLFNYPLYRRHRKNTLAHHTP